MRFGMPTLAMLDGAQQCFELANKLGLEFVEINLSFPQYQNMSADALLELSQKYGVGVTFHADEQSNPFDFNENIAAAYTAEFIKAVELAKKVNASVINMHLLRGVYVTLPDKRIFLNELYEGEFLTRVKNFGDAVFAAVGDSPLKICIENTDGFLPYELSAIDTLLKYPCFGITLDVGHNACIDFADDEFLYPREDRLCHMHLHDSKNRHPHLALGDGETDIEKYLSLAKKHDCSVVLEVKTVEGLKSSLRYLSK